MKTYKGKGIIWAIFTIIPLLYKITRTKEEIEVHIFKLNPNLKNSGSKTLITYNAKDKSITTF